MVALGSEQNETISYSRPVSHPSLSNFSKRFFSTVFTKFSYTRPSVKSISYILVSRIGFLFIFQTRLSEWSLTLPLTFLSKWIYSFPGTTTWVPMQFYRYSIYASSPSYIFWSFISCTYGRTISFSSGLLTNSK